MSTISQGTHMEQSMQSRSDGVSFCRPTLQRKTKQFFSRLMRNIEWYGRVKAARTLNLHGHNNIAKGLLEDHWK